jgi:hypothetical protein
MKVKPRMYPYPVLGYFTEDYRDSSFQTTLNVAPTKSCYIFDFKAEIINKEIEGLIKSKQARYSVHVECATTYYRKMFNSNDESFSFSIPTGDLFGNVEICSFVTSAEDIDDFSNCSFHPDYNNASFKLKTGDVIAVDRDRNFFADKDMDPLKKIPSIFTVVLDHSRDAVPYEMDPTGSKIKIKLNEENFNSYKALAINQNMHKTLASLFIWPALVSIIESLRHGNSGDGDMDEKRWYRVIGDKLKSLNIDASDPNSFIDTSVVIAHKLIGNPLSDSLKILENYDCE